MQETISPPVSTTVGTSSAPPLSGQNEQSVAVHASEPSGFKCDQPGCEKTFKTADSVRYVHLYIHVEIRRLTLEHRKHSARHKLQFSCTTCDWRFGSRSDLERHESTVHWQGTSPLWYCTNMSCRRRGRGFSRRDNFTKHMRDVHNRTEATQNTPLQPSSSRPSLVRKRKRADKAEAAAKDGSESSDCRLQALETENRKLHNEVMTLRRDREAEVQRHREVEAERMRELLACRETQAKLVGMLDRVLSKDNS